MNLLNSIYYDTASTGNTFEFGKAYNELTKNCNADRCDYIHELLIDAVTEESKRAFSKGFYTAIQLLMGGNCNE